MEYNFPFSNDELPNGRDNLAYEDDSLSNNYTMHNPDLSFLTSDALRLLMNSKVEQKEDKDGQLNLNENDAGSVFDTKTHFAFSGVGETENDMSYMNDLIQLALPSEHTEWDEHSNILDEYTHSGAHPDLSRPDITNLEGTQKLFFMADSYGSHHQRFTDQDITEERTEQTGNDLSVDFNSRSQHINLAENEFIFHNPDTGTNQAFIENSMKDDITFNKSLAGQAATQPDKLHHVDSDTNHVVERYSSILPSISSPINERQEQDHTDSESPSEKPHYIFSNHGLIINPASLMHDSGRRSVPVLNQNGPNRTHIQKQESTYSVQYNETEQPPKLVFTSATNGSVPTSQQIRQIILNRPHSVDPTLFQNNKTYGNIQEQSFEGNTDNIQNRQKQFSWNYSNKKFLSVPADSHNSKDHLKSSKIMDRKIIFKTPSSASLQSEDSVTKTPSVVSSRDSRKKLFRWASMFSNKSTKLDKMPLDDSMDFGMDHSLSSDDEVSFWDKDSDDGEDDIKKNCRINGPPADEIEVEGGTKQDAKTAVYARRWYLLFLFSVSALLWNAVWSTWGPIAQSAKVVYDWTDGDIAMFVWLGNIPFLLTMFPASYLMDVTGMRTAMIVACGFMFLGSGFRCIPSDISTASWLIRVGQFLNGMAGTIPNSGPALLSNLWFPPNQRASATAISTVAGYMGASVSFIIGPLLVPEPNDLSPVNSTDGGISNDIFADTNNVTNSTINDQMETGIKLILYAEFAVAAALFLSVIIYFPSKPPLPPSASASMPREKYIKGLKMLMKNKQFWVCALAFSIPIGVYESWQVILDVNLSNKGISQETSGWLDFYATVGGCVSGLLVSRFADFFTRQMKLFLLVFYFFSSIAILWFTLVVLNIIPFDKVSIYAAIILAGVFLDGGGPLFFELTIEVSYPVGEGVTSGFTQMLCAAAGIVFLSMVQVESLGTEWMNWCFLGCVAMALPLLFFINTTYGRADIDDMELDVSEDKPSVNANPPAKDVNENSYLFGSSHV